MLLNETVSALLPLLSTARVRMWSRALQTERRVRFIPLVTSYSTHRQMIERNKFHQHIIVVNTL